MKILLIKDIYKLGHRGDIKNLSDGYARNFLLIKNLAVPATEENIKKSEIELKHKKEITQTYHEEFHQLKIALQGQGIVIREKADAKGKLYAAVSVKEILQALQKLNFPLPKDFNENLIHIEKPIKTIGKHEAKIKLGGPASPPASTRSNRGKSQGEEEIKLQILCEPSV